MNTMALPPVTYEELFGEQPRDLHTRIVLGLASLAVAVVVVLIKVTK